MIRKYLDAGYPALYLCTTEQERALEEIIHELKETNLSNTLNIFLWKITKGLYPYTARSSDEERIGLEIRECLELMESGDDGMPPADRLYVMFNVKDLLSNPVIRQQFRDTAYAIRTVGSYIVCIGAPFTVPAELEDVITFIDFPLPTKGEIKKKFGVLCSKYKDVMKTPVTEECLELAAENACGLSAFKAENAIALSVVETRSIDITMLRKEKELAVRQTGVLEYIYHEETLDTLGGFDLLKEHVLTRKKYFRNTEKAAEFGLHPPKGLLLVGIAGCGKTQAAKAVSAALDLPLYKFDMGSVFKGIVGQSEATIRSALKMAENIAPCVLLLDEFEKAVAGLESSGKSDSGVTSRVVSTILTWMQETNAPIYKMATCNTIRNLDPALLRRGRWDAVFAVDLPTSDEREQIFAIHLKKRGRDPKDFDLQILSKFSDGFVGAEIESVVEEALYIAFDKDRDLDTADIARVCKSVVPISKTDAETIRSFREWIKGRAQNVSANNVNTKTKQGGSGVGRSLRVSQKMQ